MTDKLRAAAESCFLALDAIFTAEERGYGMAYIKGCAEAEALRLRQALDQLPDPTEMIEPSIGIVGWMYEDQLPEIYPYEEMFQFSVVDGVRMFPVYAPKSEPDTGIDRGAWSDVPDATKWVDELRGDEPVAKVCHNLPQHIGWNPKITHLPDEGTPLYAAPQKNEFECPRCGHFCQQVEEPPNSTTDVVEPVAWIVPDYGFLFPNEDSAQRYLDNIESNAAPTPLYTAPPKREWQSLTDKDIEEIWGEPVMLMYSGHYYAIREVEAKLKEKNT